MTAHQLVVHSVLLLALAMAPSWGNAQESPEQAVTRLQDVLIEAMRQGGEKDYAQSFARIAPVVDATVDLAGIARLVLGRHWRTLAPDQQARFLDSFRELSISTYVARFNEHHDEFFAIQLQESTGERVVVHSNLVRGDKPPIEFEYQLHDVDGTWRIVNIIVEGVSDLALKRAEYNALLTDGGFDALLATLDAQITRNREQRR